MINLKTKHEIELMAAAGRLLNSVITEMKAACEPGMTTGGLSATDGGSAAGGLASEFYRLVGTLRGTAPATGEHTAALLTKHGYGAAEIDKLMAEGVVATAA